MLKKIIILFTIVSVIFLTIVVVKGIGKRLFKNSVIEKSYKEKGKTYKIFGNVRRISKNIDKAETKYKIDNYYKLIYEMNFDCSICVMKLKDIYDFYLKLSKETKSSMLKFFIITKEKSESYIRYYIDKELKDYDIFIIEQEGINDGTGVYLLDKKNKIIMSGDIYNYPFLKDEYIKILKQKTGI